MERPAKKQRLQGPDGFQKAKPTSRYKPPNSITKFVSAFDDQPPSPVKSNAPLNPEKPPTGKKKPVSHAPRQAHERPQNPFVDADGHGPKEPEAGPSTTTATKAAMPKRHPKPHSFAHPPRAPMVEGKGIHPSLKVLKPPVFLPPAPAPQTSEARPPSKASSSLSIISLQLATKPLPPPAPPLHEKPRYILKPPPAPIPPSSKHAMPLKPLAPPPLPEPLPASPKKNMKTILTTNVAQATDPTKDGTGAELLSLFLQQHGHGFTSSTDRELQRGIMVSPDKRSRGKDPKFVRYAIELTLSIIDSEWFIDTNGDDYSGGLAERFQHRISCAKTDFALWSRHMEQKVESGAKFSSDMQLRVLKVLHVSKPHERSRSASGPRSGLALCRLTKRHKLASGELTLGTYVVLFSFAQTNGRRSVISSADYLEEGIDMMVWLPWQKMDVAALRGGAELLDMFGTLDELNPPHSLLVVSRFYVGTPGPKPSSAT